VRHRVGEQGDRIVALALPREDNGQVVRAIGGSPVVAAVEAAFDVEALARQPFCVDIARVDSISDSR
jgi:hypothetical protein